VVTYEARELATRSDPPIPPTRGYGQYAHRGLIRTHVCQASEHPRAASPRGRAMRTFKIFFKAPTAIHHDSLFGISRATWTYLHIQVRPYFC
jgi:hypothetical protein